jgi:HAD superfamily hydrolase (TIGR01450 family)
MRFDNDFLIRAVSLDLDGVVYEGDQVIKGADEAVDKLKGLGVEVFFVTNNSGKNRASIARKLGAMGISATIDRILTSGYGSAVLVNTLSGTRDPRILVLGSEELEQEFARFGRRTVHELPADFLVVGYDKAFTYEKLSLGLNALRQGAVFVACNRDRVFPVGDNQVLPGCGPIVASLEWAWGRKADHVVGKPDTLLLELIARERGLNPQEILVVGDSMESDIAMAVAFGSPSVLVSVNFTDTSNVKAPNLHISSLQQLPGVLSGS